MRITRCLAATAALSLAVAGLSACSGDDAPRPEPTRSAEPQAEKVVEETPEEPVDEPATEGDLPAAEWARPVSVVGDLLTTITSTSFKVDVYQVDVAQSTTDSMWVDPDTNEPILKKGDDIVILNYVFTNTSDRTILLPSLLIDVSAEYADWPWLQGMPPANDREQFEQRGVNYYAYEQGFTSPYVLKPGESFAYGEAHIYQPGSAITFEAELTPADEAGELLFDQSEEASAEATIR